MVSLSGWDIPQLVFKNKEIYFTKGNCGTGKCSSTVAVNKECHLAENVNYVLWGKMNRLCHDWMDGKITEFLDGRLSLTFTNSAGKKVTVPLIYPYTLEGAERTVRGCRRF